MTAPVKVRILWTLLLFLGFALSSPGSGLPITAQKPKNTSPPSASPPRPASVPTRTAPDPSTLTPKKKGDLDTVTKPPKPIQTDDSKREKTKKSQDTKPPIESNIEPTKRVTPTPQGAPPPPTQPAPVIATKGGGGGKQVASSTTSKLGQSRREFNRSDAIWALGSLTFLLLLLTGAVLYTGLWKNRQRLPYKMEEDPGENVISVMRRASMNMPKERRWIEMESRRNHEHDSLMTVSEDYEEEDEL